MTASPARPRLTIGVIVDDVSGESRTSLWPGIADTIQAQDGNLLCFAGGYLRDPENFSTRGNILYDLIDQARLDGLIIWASSLSSYVSRDSIHRFCDRYRPLPIVSIGAVLEGIPSVVLDSYQGMREAVVHMVTTHARRRLVFIRGPEGHRDADERYRAYQDVLKEHCLPLLPELVSPPYKWFEQGGEAAMRLMLDERHVDFDAVVCAHDGAAIEVVEFLPTRGLRVPEDVSVCGFNNVPATRSTTPPLTTIPWRMYERGRQAATLLLAMLNGERVPERVLLPTRLIVRQSCGCLDPTITLAQAGSQSDASTTKRRGAQGDQPYRLTPLMRQTGLSEIEQVIEEKERFTGAVSQFLDAFFADLQGDKSGVFISTLEGILRQVVAIGGDIPSWQSAVSVLRRQLLPSLQNDPDALVRAEDLWHQARVILAERSRRVRAYQAWNAMQQTERLRRISHGLATMTTVPDLMNVLAAELPHLGISACYLALYEDPAQPTEWSRLVLAYDENGRVPLGPEGRPVRSRDFAMGTLVPSDKAYRMLVAPLYFQDEQLGLVLFSQRPVGDIYEVLRDEISTTLKGVMLAQQNVQLYQQALEAQKAAQEGRRLAEEADRLKSSYLSMVSHELLTPLVLLVGLSEMMLRSPGTRPPLPEPYRSDLARIHLSAAQLGNLVRDVLDLTRSQMGQLKLTKKPLDLREMLQSVALVGEDMAHGKDLEWRVEIPEELPLVLGDASRLQQVVLNLVTNAVKFTARGNITLKVEVGEESVTISVSDTGLGVPQEEQEGIFDEFRQSERTVARGYGGLGIGLAICRQLVELHGGQMGVSSSGEEEGGSTFYFALPTIAETHTDGAAQPSTAQTVLLLTQRVTGNSAQLEQYLTGAGFQVRALYTDETPDWLPQVVAIAPGAVILDSFIVGDLSPSASTRGAQLIELLKQNLPTQDIPILFYSLHGPDAGGMLALDYMTKPMGAADLAQVLQRYGLTDGESGAGESVLVVDDDPGVLEMHTRIIRECLPKSQVRQAANGRIALELMQQEPPALVLLDLMMPELDGMGVIAAMQESDRLRGIPVIVLTAQVLTQKDMAQLNRGVAAVLQKGLFTAQETITHIERTLARDKRLGTEALRMVYKVMAFIHEHYAEPISREEMAAFVGVSARHLTRCFHQEVGISPITYLNRYRVQKAKQLLQAGEQNITEIAAAVGFSSSNYFTDAFRRETGMSPRDYQKTK